MANSNKKQTDKIITFITSAKCRIEHLMVLLPTGEVQHTFIPYSEPTLGDLIRKAEREGLIGEDGKWKIPLEEVAICVDIIGEALGLDTKWAWAEQRWNLRFLRIKFCKAMRKMSFDVRRRALKALLITD